jgi:hypothetical protein
MRRQLLISMVFLLLIVASFAMWSLHRPSVTPMIVPGATNIRVLQPSMREQVISYQAPGSAYAWRTLVERDLTRQGWVATFWRNPSTTAVPIYVRIRSFWIATILDEAALDGEPNIARIRLRRWVELPCILLPPSRSNPINWLGTCMGFYPIGVTLGPSSPSPLLPRRGEARDRAGFSNPRGNAGMQEKV